MANYSPDDRFEPDSPVNNLRARLNTVPHPDNAVRLAQRMDRLTATAEEGGLIHDDMSEADSGALLHKLYYLAEHLSDDSFETIYHRRESAK